MSEFAFDNQAITTVATVLGSTPTQAGNDVHFAISGERSGQALTLTLANAVPMSEHGDNAALVKAQTPHGYFELHYCNGFVPVEPDEIIFYAARGEFLSCMVVGKEGTCSVFMNIRRENLSADFAELDPHLLLSAMQLSLIDTEIPEDV